ncbi:hypothetical protein [Sinosporangium siamense]|uniref:Uncharacterized protein n=1 Tax=Sinosporangium siamense TaxID=1367973 RepID=A0A919RPJ9_9ACTN|nr:hypothetical protein [Sinosporangium siamense]GII96056.1 hypothetical protein Ssi02_62870 [Sinosporangium siamense]
MKRSTLLGLAAVAASVTLATSSGAWAATPSTPAATPAPTATAAPTVPDAVGNIADSILQADQTLRGPGLRTHYNLWVVGLRGTATVRDKGSKFINYTWQRGTLTAKTDTSVTVTSKDGYVQTWTLHDTTRFRRLAKRADLSKLVVGDGVFALGVPGAAAPTAAAVFVPKNRAVLDAPSAPAG